MNIRIYLKFAWNIWMVKEEPVFMSLNWRMVYYTIILHFRSIHFIRHNLLLDLKGKLYTQLFVFILCSNASLVIFAHIAMTLSGGGCISMFKVPLFNAKVVYFFLNSIVVYIMVCCMRFLGIPYIWRLDRFMLFCYYYSSALLNQPASS